MGSKRIKYSKIVLPAGGIAVILFFIIACSGLSGNLKNTDELLNYKNAEASDVYSDDGILLGRFFQENRTNTTLEKVPGHLIDALIATEDARFYEHKGYDARSFFRVLVKTVILNNKSSGGGSTISQQLAKNMFGRKNYSLFPVLRNKLTEVIMARRLEKVFSKDEILSLYLNTVSFGENVFGVEAAAVRFFNKSAFDLKAEESAVLVGMLKANTFYNPRLHPDNALKRRNVVISQMERYGYITSRHADSLVEIPMRIKYNRSGASGSADYFLVQVRKDVSAILGKLEVESGKKWDPERDGLSIYTTLNGTLQKYVLGSFRDHLSVMQERLTDQYGTREGRRIIDKIVAGEMDRLDLNMRSDEKRLQEVFSWNGTGLDSLSVADSIRYSLTLLHAGLLAMDPGNGAVRAWAGGIDFKTQPWDQVLARRQMASVFKPVIYLAALEDGMEPCQYLDNDSVALSGFDDWSPENYDHSFGGKYSLSGALKHSMNIPTFSLFLKIGFEKVDSMWRKLGFSFPLSNTPSLAMGTAEANIKEVAVAYSAFANGGYLIEPYYVQSIKSKDGEVIYSHEDSFEKIRVFSERSGILMSAILQKAVSEGTGTSVRDLYNVDIPLAGKTGTSQDYSDAWFAAFNPKIVIVSRVGASSRAIHFNSGSNGSGSSLALPLVALTLKKTMNDPEIRDMTTGRFQELPPELEGTLDCPDFKEKNLFDKIIDIFEKDDRPYRRSEKETERRIRSFINKIFKKG